MARHGVTYQDVAQAANQLVAQGKNPTIEQIRLILGTGSSTTLANHLRQWRENQNQVESNVSKENLPSEFLSMMKGLWERVIDQSDEQVSSIEKEFQQTITNLQQELQKYKNNNKRWQKLYTQWMQERERTTNELMSLEQALEFRQKENDNLHTKNDSLMQRIEELQAIQRQQQENIERDRQLTRERDLLTLQKHENQLDQLQKEIKNRDEQILHLQQDQLLLQQKYAVLENNYQQIIIQKTDLSTQLENEKSSHQDSREKLQRFQAMHEESQEKLSILNQQQVDIKTELVSLNQKYAKAEFESKERNEQQKQLIKDLINLSQEKSILESQLKKLQETISEES